MFVVYATRPAALEGILRAALGRFDHAAAAWVNLLFAVERQQTPQWDLPVPALGWELWQDGAVSRPLAAATDAPATLTYRRELAEVLLGDLDYPLALYRAWAAQYPLLIPGGPTRLTTVSTPAPANDGGADHERHPAWATTTKT